MSAENINAKDSADFMGKGFKWIAETRMLYFTFEVEGIANDEAGAPILAGARIKVGPCQFAPTVEECKESVAKIVRNGLEGHKATPVGYAKYLRLYENEPEGAA